MLQIHLRSKAKPQPKAPAWPLSNAQQWLAQAEEELAQQNRKRKAEEEEAALNAEEEAEKAATSAMRERAKREIEECQAKRLKMFAEDHAAHTAAFSSFGY